MAHELVPWCVLVCCSRDGDAWSFRMGVARVIAGWLWPECAMDVALIKLAVVVALMKQESAAAPLEQASACTCCLHVAGGRIIGGLT